MESKVSSSKQRFRRCAAWLATQGSQPQDSIAPIPPEMDVKVEPAETVKTVPAAVDEDEVMPKKVPLRKLRTDGLRMECEWRDCLHVTADYDTYQKHVRTHIPHLQVINGPDPKYNCLWDICHHQSSDSREMIRHVNYHAYHAKLMAIGVSLQFNQKLQPCLKDSTKRNKLPVQSVDYRCRWVDCNATFTAIQEFFTHLEWHAHCVTSGKCAWAGCGVKTDGLKRHLRTHSGERLVACPHCGMHTATNAKLCEHLERQNIINGGAPCSYCGRVLATPRMLREHKRQHVCMYACTFCDMTAHSTSALSNHVRFRHLAHLPGSKPFKCDTCSYSCVTMADLKRHMARHNRIKKKPKDEEDDDEENCLVKKPEKAVRHYICHMCPEGREKIFSRGTRLTSHLGKKHGVRWPDGHVRFRYQKSEDGYYRLTTTRYECQEVSREIERGSSAPKRLITEGLHVRLKKKSSAGKHNPVLFQVQLNSESDSENLEIEEDVESVDLETKEDLGTARDTESREALEKSLQEEVMLSKKEPNIEITMCDVDEDGNVIRSELVNSVDIILGL